MATATWLAAAGGDWFNAANWDVNGATAVPTAADTAFIGLSGAYTVTLIAATHVGAITLTDPQGDLRLAAPGSQVDVDGTVTNAGRLEINGASGTATAMAVGGSVINSGNLELRNHGTLTIGGDLLNTGFVGLDWEAFSLEGGSGLTVTGTLVDNGAMTVGIVSGGLSATTTVTAGALAGSGSLTIAGNGTNQAAVYILAAAPSVLGLNATLNDNATLQFASGLIGTIASGKTLRLNGARAVVSDASDPATNSALTGLSLIAGAMQLVNGASLALSNPLTITSSGALSLDADSFTAEGGASLTITGGLTNAGALAIGPGTGGLGAPTTLTADSLINTGSIRLVGNFDAASTNVATMAIASAAGFGAAGILSGSVFVDGKSNLTFASGQIGTIASGARLDLRGLGLISNAAALTRNSALDGLSSIAGVLDVAYGQTVAVGNDVSIAAGGQWLIDGDSFSGEGNSRVTISGTLANAGGLTIGVPTGGAPGPTYVSAAALVNTGAIALTGNFNAASTASATLAIAAAAGFGAAGVASGTIRLNGQAHLEFGSGQIGTVAPGAELRLWGLARLADASDPTRNSALDGLSLVAGTFNLAYGETLTVANSVSITSSGQWLIDGDSFSAQGNSRVSVNGTLTNAGGLTIGVPTGDAPGPTYVSAAALTNTGVITLTGNVNAASTATATLAVASAAGLGTAGVISGIARLNGQAHLEFGSGQIGTVASGAELRLWGLARLANASDPTRNSALDSLSLIAGDFNLAYGETLAIGNDVSITSTGRWFIDGDGFSGQGSSEVTVSGTLVNAGALTIGPTTADGTGPTRVTAAALVNTGAVTLTGNAANGSPNTADLIIGGSAGFGTTGVLTGDVLLNGHSHLQFGSGGLGTIASGAQLRLWRQALLSTAADPDHNSALAPLSRIDGQFDLAYGQTLAIGNDVSIGSAGAWSIDGDGFTGQGGSDVTIAGTVTNAGNLTIGESTGSGSAPTHVGAAAFANTGSFRLTGSTSAPGVLQIGGSAANSSNAVIGTGGTLIAANFTQQAGELTIGGRLVANSATLAGGTVHGVGTIDSDVLGSGAALYGGDDFTPTGTLSMTGGLTLTGGHVIERLSGTGAAQDSEIHVQGPISLNGGTLDLVLLNGFTLAANETFSVLSATPGQLTGAFSSILVNGTVDSGTGSSPIGNGLFLTPVYDVLAGSMTLRVSSTPFQPPVIAAPSGELLNVGFAGAVGPLSISSSQPGTLTVTLSDSFGLLSATSFGAGTVQGNNSTHLTLTGDLFEINQALASLTDTPQGTPLNDTLAIVVTDSALQTTNTVVAVTINQPPVLALPPSAFEGPNAPEPLTGISVSDLSAIADDETLQAVLSATAGLLSATQHGSGTVSGANTSHLTLTGKLGDLNAQLASLTFNGSASDTLHISVTDGNGLIASGTLAVGVSDPLSFTLPSGSLTFANGVQQALAGVGLVAPPATSPDLVTTLTVSSAGGAIFVSAPAGVIAGGNGTGTLTLTGSVAALNTALGTLTYAGPAAGSADTVTFSTPSGTGGSTIVSVPVTLVPPGPPLITIPVAAANTGVLTPIDGLSVANAVGLPITTQMTVTLSNAAALLGLQRVVPGATVTGLGTTSLTLTGTAAQIDADLAQLTFLDAAGGVPGTVLETISITASALGATANGSLSVNIPPAFGSTAGEETAPGILQYLGILPFNAASNVGATMASNGNLQTFYLSLPASGPGQYAIGALNNDPLPINVSFEVQSAPVGFTTAVAPGGAPVNGLVPLDFGYLLTAVDQLPHIGDTITYIIKSTDSHGAVLPDRRITLTFGPAPGQGGGFGVPATNGPGTTVITSQTSGDSGEDEGDVHITTFDHLLYDFQAVGEFVLARAKAPGDTFEVQVRTANWQNSATASMTTAAAARLGTHRITFDIARGDTVWVDGHAVPLSAGGAPVDLGEGTVRQLTANSWTVRWDSGETMTVARESSWLNVRVSLTPRATPGSVEGLLGRHTGDQAQTFALPNGTVLPQPLSYHDLYVTWANAWRVTDATSLLDYGAGQTTADFTDPNFPSDAQPLNLFPADLIAQAQSLAAAAGITNPALQRAAIVDYLLTGDPGFIAAAAQGLQPSAYAPEPNSPGSAGGVGVYAAAPAVTQSPSGDTHVSFNVYRIGDSIAAQVVDWQVRTGMAGQFGASDFAGGVLPSGQVTIVAGGTLATFTVDIASHLGTLAAETLAVGIDTGASGTALLAPVASTQVINNTPQAGIDAVPIFVNQGLAGTLSHVGNAYTLDLGTFDRDSVPSRIEALLVNAGAVAADLLSGTFSASQPTGIGLASGLQPATNLRGGDSIPLTFQLNTATDGAVQQTVTFVARESNASGFQANLGTLTLTVLANVVAPPSGVIVPTSIDFGAVHQGDTVAQAVTITNVSNQTLVAHGTISGDLTTIAAAVTVAPHATDSTGLRIGLSTGSQGIKTGTIIVPLASPNNGGVVTGVLLQVGSVAATGSFSHAASLLLDGVVPAAGTSDDSAQAVSWTDTSTAFTYDFGFVRHVNGALLSVDRTGTYVVSGSTDDVTFAPLFTITPLTGATPGLGTRSSLPNSLFHDASMAFAPTYARYVRLQAIGGAGTYAASELDLFGPTPTLSITGTVFALAAPFITISDQIVHVGDAGHAALTVANNAPTGGFGENLLAVISGTPTGGLTLGSTTATGAIAPGSSGSLTLDYSTALNGVISGQIHVALTSDGGTGPGSIDGLGTSALPAQDVAVNVQVNAYANPEFQADNAIGSIVNGTLDIGAFQHNSDAAIFHLDIVNDVTGPVDLLSGSLSSTGGFLTTGLGSFSGLGAGQHNTAPTFTLETLNNGVVVQTVTLSSRGSNASGFDAALPTETLTLIGTVADLPLPTITVSPTLTSFQRQPTLVGPIAISDPNTVTQAVTVTVSDIVGALAASSAGQASIRQSDSHTLTVIGSLTDVNATLASLTYAADALGSDTITIKVRDQHHAEATQTIAVTDIPVPKTQAILNGPTRMVAVLDRLTSVSGLQLVDPGAMASGETITLSFFSAGATLVARGTSNATVTGNGTEHLVITGTVQEINALLGDDVAYGFLVDALKDGGVIGSQTADILKVETAEGLVTAVGGPTEAKFFEVGVENVTYELLRLLSLIPGNPEPSFAEHIKRLAEIIFGKPEIVLADGSIYNLEAAGEFVLAASKQNGDSFLVEARLQPVEGSSTTSEMTQVAAQVGHGRVTFDIDRASFVYVNGTATTLGLNAPLDLDGGRLTRLSATDYQVTWNTGEVLDILNSGTFLSAEIAGGPNSPDGSIVGLIGNGATASANFVLPSGVTLAAPLSETDLRSFIDAWRVVPSVSILDYEPGQDTTTFTDLNFGKTRLTLADLPASVVANAASVVAATGVADPGAQQAMQLDYITSGGDRAALMVEANLFTGLASTPLTMSRSGPAPLVAGVIARDPIIEATGATTTPVEFDVYLTGTRAVDTVIPYAVVSGGAGYLDGSAFGGAFPSGSATIVAGQTLGHFSINLPANALGTLATENLKIQILAPTGVGLINATAQATIDQPIAGPPPVPVLRELANLGTFWHDGNHYYLNLGTINYGDPLPPIAFAIDNAGTIGVDSLTGTFEVPTMAGFKVMGANVPQPLRAGESYQGLNVALEYTKFGRNEQTITFRPVDTNSTGFSAPLAPITLTVTDTIIPPAKRYSYAYADVHIITYDGTYYDFQAAGEFTLAKSRLPGHSFDIQLRLEPWSRSVGVTYITQAAVAVGSHRVTFDPGRTSVVQIDGAPTTLSLANPLINLPDGTVKVLSENVYRVDWNTGEEATFSINGFMINVADGIPLSLPQAYAGLQGEAAGQANDFQLADGTVLEQPLSTTDLYGRFADAWRVTQSSSLFDYEAGESTATFTDKGFPLNLVSVNDLPTDAVAKAEALVAAAGVTDPNIARGAVLDYLATGDHSFIAAAADVNAQQFITVGPTITPAPTTTPVAGVVAELASVLEATSGATHVVFDAYLTRPNATDTTLFYHVVDGGLGFLGATDFGLTLPAGTVTIAAGQTIGAFTIDVPFDALGTDAAAKLQVSIDAPGSVVPIFAPDAVANIVNNDPHAGAAPVPVLSKLTPFGTLTHVGNAYTLDLGTLSIGEDSPVIQLAVSNDADAPADSLSGVFGVPLGNGFTVIGNHLDAALLPGRSYTGLKVDALTDLAGDHVETMTFSPRAVNESGYIGTMDPITLVIKDTVITPADLRLNTPSTIIYPNVRVGTPVSTALSITNIGAQTGGRPLAVTGDAFGFATVNGGIVSLVPGATDITSIRVGIDTSFVGQLAGIVELDPVSNNPNGTTTPTASTATINEFVSVYRLASGSVAPMTRFVHVGDTGTINAVISNTATADGYSEALIASLDKLTGAFIPLSSGPTGPIAAGGSTAALSFGFNATQVGTIHGDITFDLFSDGGTGSNSIDGLGTMALADLAAPIDVIVNNYATASISSDRLLTKIGEHNYLLNLGTAAIGNGALTAGLTIGNTATGPADLLGGRFSVRGPGVFADTGFGLFGSLAAGDLLQAGTISLSRSTAGLFTQIITLAPTDSNASGYFQQMGGETITVVGSIVAPTGSGNGDVHMTTFSGVKYDFQAVGAFVLERSTAPGNDMEVQIETGGVHGALSLTTKVAARLGPDVVTIAPGRDSLVWLNGEADTALGTANPIQNLAGGQIRQLRPDMVRITWNSGETLTITHPSKFGSIDYLNTSMALGPNNTPGSVEGLLGSFDDPASDIQMPDGTVLLQPVSNAELVGPFAAAWSVTPDTTLLDETTNAMRFLAKPDAGVLCATAAKQVLMPSGGVDTLSDANHVGAVFTGTLSDLAKVLIDSFSKQDAIDVTDLPFAGVLASYSGSADDGLLLLSNGAQTGSLHLSGSLANGTFHVASDQHGGSLITFG